MSFWKLPNLISRKFRVAEKLVNFHTVQIFENQQNSNSYQLCEGKITTCFSPFNEFFRSKKFENTICLTFMYKVNFT